MLHDRSLLVTGASGSFGTGPGREVAPRHRPRRVEVVGDVERRRGAMGSIDHGVRAAMGRVPVATGERIPLRFALTVRVRFVLAGLRSPSGGASFGRGIPTTPSRDPARAIGPSHARNESGIRPGVQPRGMRIPFDDGHDSLGVERAEVARGAA